MPTVAQQLRSSREAQNLSIEDVANLTKLRTDHVRALESGDYKVFSAPVYVRGFTRTYAKLVKLDPQAVLDTLSSELEQGTSKKSDDGHNNLPSKGIVEVCSAPLSRINWKNAPLPLLILSVLIATEAWAFELQLPARAKIHWLISVKESNLEPSRFHPSICPFRTEFVTPLRIHLHNNPSQIVVLLFATDEVFDRHPQRGQDFRRGFIPMLMDVSTDSIHTKKVIVF